MIILKVPSFQDNDVLNLLTLRKARMRKYSVIKNLDKSVIDKDEVKSNEKVFESKTKPSDDNILYDLRIWDTTDVRKVL